MSVNLCNAGAPATSGFPSTTFLSPHLFRQPLLRLFHSSQP